GTCPSREAGVRPDTAKSKLRIPAFEKTFFAVHTGDRGTDHGNPEGTVRDSSGPVHLHTEGWRFKESGVHHLCRGMDASQLWHADHPHGGDPATAAGERWQSRRRRKCSARTFEHSRG